MIPEPVVVHEHEGWQRCGHCGADVREEYMDEHLEQRCITLHPDPVPGCDGAHGGPCRGKTWACAGCPRTPCYAEGSDDLPELCDRCWHERRRARG